MASHLPSSGIFNYQWGKIPCFREGDKYGNCFSCFTCVLKGLCQEFFDQTVSRTFSFSPRYSRNSHIWVLYYADLTMTTQTLKVCLGLLTTVTWKDQSILKLGVTGTYSTVSLKFRVLVVDYADTRIFDFVKWKSSRNQLEKQGRVFWAKKKSKKPHDTFSLSLSYVLQVKYTLYVQ